MCREGQGEKFARRVSHFWGLGGTHLPPDHREVWLKLSHQRQSPQTPTNKQTSFKVGAVGDDEKRPKLAGLSGCMSSKHSSENL